MCIDTDLDLPSRAKDTYQTFAYLASYFSQINMKQITLSHMSHISVNPLLPSKQTASLKSAL